MKPVLSSFFYIASFALLMAGSAKAGLLDPGQATASLPEEEHVCIGPGSITGKVVDATTVLAPHFSAYRCLSHRPVQIAVQFKDPSSAMRVGDTVTLEGRLVHVQDPQRNVEGYVLRNAKIAQ